MDEWKRLKLAFLVDKWSTRLAWAVFAVAMAGSWFDAARGHWGKAVALLIVALTAARVAYWEPPLITFKDEDEES
jgi:hypothetical protein